MSRAVLRLQINVSSAAIRLCASLALTLAQAAGATSIGPNVSLRADTVSSEYRGTELITTIRVTVHNPGPESLDHVGFGTCYDNGWPGFYIRPARSEGCSTDGGVICFDAPDGWGIGDVPSGSDATCQLELVAGHPLSREDAAWPIWLGGPFLTTTGEFVYDIQDGDNATLLIFENPVRSVPAMGGIAAVTLTIAIVLLSWLRLDTTSNPASPRSAT